MLRPGVKASWLSYAVALHLSGRPIDAFNILKESLSVFPSVRSVLLIEFLFLNYCSTQARIHTLQTLAVHFLRSCADAPVADRRRAE